MDEMEGHFYSKLAWQLLEHCPTKKTTTLKMYLPCERGNQLKPAGKKKRK